MYFSATLSFEVFFDICNQYFLQVPYWKAKDQWSIAVDFDLPMMVDFNFSGNTDICRLLDHG